MSEVEERGHNFTSNKPHQEISSPTSHRDVDREWRESPSYVGTPTSLHQRAASRHERRPVMKSRTNDHSAERDSLCVFISKSTGQSASVTSHVNDNAIRICGLQRPDVGLRDSYRFYSHPSSYSVAYIMTPC